MTKRPALLLACLACLPSPASAQVPAPADVAEAAAGLEPPPAPAEAATTAGRPRLTADEAARRAVSTSPSREAADAAVRIAEASAMQAMAGLLPHLELRGRATLTNAITNRLGSPPSDADVMLAQTALANVQDPNAQALLRGLYDNLVFGSGFSFPYYRSQYELSASLTYPVTTAMLTLLPMYRAAGRQIDAATLQRDVDRLHVALRARETYYEHVRAQGGYAIAVEARDTARAHRERVAALVAAGVASNADLLQIDAQLASAEVGVQNAELGVLLSGRALGLLISSEDDPETGPFDVGSEFAAPPTAHYGSPAELETQALADRLELRALSLAVEARDLEERAQARSRFPQVALQGNVQYMNPNTRYIPQSRQFRSSWDISAVVTWSPNDAVLSEGRRRQAAAARAQLEAQEAQLRDSVRLEVSQAHQAYLSAQATYQSTAAAETAAVESLRVREAQLAEGVAVATELADARTALLRARLEHVDAAIAMHLARARLDTAIGAAE